MAKLNYSESAPLASGKVGGQQIIKNRHGVILQSISQPPSFGTVEQKKQRFVTNTLAQKWKQLTASQKQSFADSATTWFKKSKTGQLINQTPYGLFLFLQQNSALIGEDGPLFGVDYQSLIEPQAYLVSKSQTSIIVKSDNTVNDYEYLVFIDPRTTDFRVSQLNSELLVGRLTALELGNGTDVAHMIQSHYNFPLNMSKISTRISAVEMGTGRRSEDIRWLYQLPKSEYLGSVFTGRNIQLVAIASDGTKTVSGTQNSNMYGGGFSTPFNINSYTETYNQRFFQNNTYGIGFSQDGHHFYNQRRSSTLNQTEHRHCPTPYDLRGSILIDVLPSDYGTNTRGFYISNDGLIFIQTSNSGTAKYQLQNPYELQNAVLIDFNPDLKQGSAKSYMFSNDGLIFILYDLHTITSYQLAIPFDITDLTSNPIKTVNLTDFLMPSSLLNRWMSMSYDGLYYTIATGVNQQTGHNLHMFKNPSPFKLADF